MSHRTDSSGWIAQAQNNLKLHPTLYLGPFFPGTATDKQNDTLVGLCAVKRLETNEATFERARGVGWTAQGGTGAGRARLDGSQCNSNLRTVVACKGSREAPVRDKRSEVRARLNQQETRNGPLLHESLERVSKGGKKGKKAGFPNGWIVFTRAWCAQATFSQLNPYRQRRRPPQWDNRKFPTSRS